VRGLPCRIVNRDSAFLEKLDTIQKRLVERGANPDIVTFVSDVLLQQHQRYHESLTAEVEKRKVLTDLLKRLEVGLWPLSLLAISPLRLT
jgi:hypothetical protein